LAKRRNLPGLPGSSPVDPFSTLYPNVAGWVRDGWIEIGRDDCNRSFVRALDIGGLVWEGAASYPTMHAALLALDEAIAAWVKKHG
jgi:hypothetical protein